MPWTCEPFVEASERGLQKGETQQPLTNLVRELSDSSCMSAFLRLHCGIRLQNAAPCCWHRARRGVAPLAWVPACSQYLGLKICAPGQTQHLDLGTSCVQWRCAALPKPIHSSQELKRGILSVLTCTHSSHLWVLTPRNIVDLGGVRSLAEARVSERGRPSMHGLIPAVCTSPGTVRRSAKFHCRQTVTSSALKGSAQGSGTDDTGLFRDVWRSCPARRCRCRCCEDSCKAPRSESARSRASFVCFLSPLPLDGIALLRFSRHGSPKGQYKGRFSARILRSQEETAAQLGILATPRHHQMSTALQGLVGSGTDDTGLFRDVWRSCHARRCRCRCCEASCKAPRFEAARSRASLIRFLSPLPLGWSCAP